MAGRGRWLPVHALALTSALGCSSKPPPSDIGCGEFEDPSQVDICNRIRTNLAWERGGHAWPFGAPSWRCTRDSVQKVICSAPRPRVEEVAAAHAALHTRKTFDGELSGCLDKIKDALQEDANPVRCSTND